MSSATDREVPDIGDTFDYDGHGFRVSGWLKPAPRRGHATRDVGPDACPLMFCTRDEAVYVTASGVCVVIRRVADVEITGRVDWPAEQLAAARRGHECIVGREIR